MKRSVSIALSLLFDAVAAGMLLFIVCLWVFLLPRELDSTGIQGSDGNVRLRTLPWAKRLAEFFSEEPIVTKSSYAGPSVSVSLRTMSRDLGTKHSFTYHVADVRVADLRCIRTVLAHDSFGVGINEPILDMMARSDAILAMNGDYYSYQEGGLVVRNGEVLRSEPSDADVCVLFLDGRMEIVPPDYDLDALIRRGIWQAWTFGPSLLDESGHAVRSTIDNNNYLRLKHPRSAIGYVSPGHYVFVVCDGRQPGYSDGTTLFALAQVMEDLGCRIAYNLDGGNSSVLAFRGALWSRPSSDGRAVSDCILVKEFVP